MMMTINFRLRETSRRKLMLPLLLRMFGADDFRQAEQLRADLQPRLIGGVQVDFELHPVSVIEEIDDSPLERKGCRFADGEDTRAFKRFENHWHVVLLRRTDEKDMAGYEFREFSGLLQNQD